MDPTELPSNPDDAEGASTPAAEPVIQLEPEVTGQPADTVSEAAQPALAEPDQAEPAPSPTSTTGDPATAHTADEALAQPAATSAASPTSEPATIEPAATQPAAVELTATQPGAGEPTAVEPTAIEPTAIEPTATVDPAVVVPDPAETIAAEDAGASPEEPVRPVRVITSSGAPGSPAGVPPKPGGAAPDPSGAAADRGAIPPPPGPGSPGTASAPSPSLGEIRGLRSGQIIEGRVTQVDANEVVLETDDGSVGVIGKRHLTATGQTVPTELLSVGDRVEAAVLIRDDPRGRLVLSRAWALKQRAWEVVETAKAANKPLTGRVTGLVKGGLVVDVGTRAFLPASQIDLQHVEDLSSFVGQDIEALVHEADRINDKVVLSRRNLLRQAQRAKANEVVSTLAPGQVHKGRVSLLTDFGAFVEIGGVRGLVHLSEISWARVDRAADVLSPGDEVDVKVLAIKSGKKLSLSIRALSPDPLAGLETGQVLSGVVTRLADFGAFVRVGDGAEGLVHVTELAEYRVHAPEEVVTPGDEVLVKVLRIDRKRRRLDLSVNQAVLS
ncbi:MAG: S1 RNA-binding domain-containing protein [Acidimicrobiales bacterium]